MVAIVARSIDCPIYVQLLPYIIIIAVKYVNTIKMDVLFSDGVIIVRQNDFSRQSAVDILRVRRRVHIIQKNYYWCEIYFEHLKFCPGVRYIALFPRIPVSDCSYTSDTLGNNEFFFFVGYANAFCYEVRSMSVPFILTWFSFSNFYCTCIYTNLQ